MNGLVLEGGARRCIFTAGVTDCFMENNLKFDYIAGVSAGAQIAVDYISNQKGRSKDVILPHNDGNHGFIKSLYSSDLKKLTYEYPYKQYPFDFEEYFKSPIKCEIVVTNCTTGEAEYLTEKKDEQELLKKLCASCSLPFIYPSVNIDGEEYVDGSISDAIPFERALKSGCERVVVILAKPIEESATNYSKIRFAVQKKYGAKFPKLAERLLDRIERYEAETERLYKAEKEGKVFILRPDKTYVKSFERNTANLDIAYNAGYGLAKRELENIKEFML